MRGVLGTLALAAGLAFWQAPGAPAVFADRTGPYLGEKPPGPAPAVFAPGLVSTGGFERDVAITPDGREIFFGLAGPSYQYTTVVSTRVVDGRWSEPEVVPGLDDPRYLHLEPALSVDGSTLYFLSTRPDPAAGVQAGNQDIWMMTRTPAGWSPPVNLGAPVNSALPEYFPSLTRDGTIYFTREEAGSRVSAIWRARREGGGYRDPERLPAQVNSGRSHFNAFVAPDESYVIVPTDGRPDSIGGCDYYVVFRTPDDRWSQPINLGPAVNTKGSQEFSPYVSPDGKYFFFMSSRPAAPERLTFRLFRDLHDRPGNGNADIYWVDAGLVTSLRAKAVFGQGDTIHGAARAGDLATVRALVEKDVKLALARDEAGRTPLHLAAGSGRADVAAYLVARGADVNAADNNAWTPLHAAAAADRDEAVRILIDGKAALESRTSEGETPLAVAAGRGAARAAARLLQAGAATEAANAYGRTPLLLVARESGKADIARLLLDGKANVDAKDKFGDTPLTLAAWKGFAEVVDLLIQRGAAVPSTGPAAERLLQSAAEKGLDRLFAALAGKGVDLSKRTARGGTLLHDAAGGGSAAIVGELLARKFAVDDADRDGWTPLHNAAFMGRLDIVKALAAGGFDLNARNVLGQTAWNLARENGLADVADWLASNGASQDAPRFPALTGAYLGQPPPGRTPTEFAVGIVGGHFNVHSSPAFSPDGRELYWSESIPPRGTGYSSGRTMMSRRAGDPWTYPARAMVGAVPLEDVPVITADGKHIYDMARRPIAGQTAGKENIWVADRLGDQWGAPRPLDPSINALPHHWQFAVGSDRAVYFSSNWNGASGLFVSRPAGGRYEEPVALGAPVRASGREAMPFVAADGSYLLFQRNYDIYVSFRAAEGAWLPPAPLPAPVNTPDMELCPVVSPDGRYLFFMRSGHVYWVDAAVIEDLRPGARR
jgi:ankyrin repeat protein